MSKMRLLKTHSHTSNGLAMELRTREEKKLKETQTLQQGKVTHQKTDANAGSAGGGGGQKNLYNLPQPKSRTVLPRFAFSGRGGWFGGAGPGFPPKNARCGSERGRGQLPASRKVRRVPADASCKAPR